jgi:hypothetical protein
MNKRQFAKAFWRGENAKKTRLGCALVIESRACDSLAPIPAATPEWRGHQRPGKEKTMSTRKIGRSAISGKFVPVKYTETHKPTTIVQTIKMKPKGK